MESSIKKIWFTGSHGTGKTTQLEYFRTIHPEYSKLNLEVRDLVELGIININKKAKPWDELAMKGRAMLQILSASSPFICDRSWVCKCAYAQALPFPQELLEAYHVENTCAFPGIAEDELYIYFPPMIPLEDDGVRSIDPEYQKEIDLLVQFYLDFFQIPFYTMETLSVQDRNFEIERVVFGEI